MGVLGIYLVYWVAVGCIGYLMSVLGTLGIYCLYWTPIGCLLGALGIYCLYWTPIGCLLGTLGISWVCWAGVVAIYQANTKYYRILITFLISRRTLKSQIHRPQGNHNNVYDLDPVD